LIFFLSDTASGEIAFAYSRTNKANLVGIANSSYIVACFSQLFSQSGIGSVSNGYYDSVNRDFLVVLSADNNAVVITDLLTDELISYAKKGGKVLVAASEGLVRAFHPQGVLSPAPYKKYRYYFTKPASYPPYEEGQYGTLLTKSSPLFGNFPIPEDAIHAGLQFFNLIGACAPLDAAPLGLDKKGVAMRMIHTWQCCRSLAELAWYSCGEGSIAISSIDFDQSRVEARSLLGNILDAMKNAPAPEAVISEETLKNICDAAILLD